MTRIALRNLVTKPATRRYPFVVREPFAATRGRIVIDFPTCIHCMACAKHCPADAIVVDRLAKSWSIDRFACVVCGACVRACPKDCLAMENKRQATLDFAAVPASIERHVAPASPPPLSSLASDA
jgi:formate hydrogenlyase subunit 6/NADH:ubiquinone oxidoreductase subunit I